MSEDDQIRRLLADAKHTDPIPPDVAGRMDGVIADLRADRPVRATVTDLDAARRRRRARTLLVAAAAVVVAGIGIDQLRGLQTGGDDSAAGSTSADSAEAHSDTDSGGGREAPATASPLTVPGEAVRLDAQSFARQAAELRRAFHGDRGALEYDTTTTDGVTVAPAPAPTCSLPDVGRGRVIAVRYAGTPGALVFRRPTGDSQVVDLYLCGSDEPARSVTLPAP